MKTRGLSFLLCFGLLHATLVAAAQPPNIVLIMADDLGYTDVAAFGSGYYETPNIDKLAAQGMKLTSFHRARTANPPAPP